MELTRHNPEEQEVTRSVLSQGCVSASAITPIETCEAKAYLEYEEGWEKVSKSGGLKTGLLMHDGQEMYLNGHNESAVINSLEQEAKDSGYDEDELFLPKLRAYIKGYYERWETEDAETISNGATEFSNKYDLEGTEVAFNFELDGITFSGRIDAVLYDREDDCMIMMEHKNLSPLSVSSKDLEDSTSLFWKSLVLNNQVTIYTTFLAMQYKRPVKLWYDVVQTSPATKPKMKPGKTVNKVKQPGERETLDEFEERLTNQYRDQDKPKYMRKMIPILEDKRKERMQEILSIASKAQGMAYLANPIRNTTSCKDYGGCAFFSVCIGDENIYDNPKFDKKKHFKKENENEHPF